MQKYDILMVREKFYAQQLQRFYNLRSPESISLTNAPKYFIQILNVKRLKMFALFILSKFPLTK